MKRVKCSDWYRGWGFGGDDHMGYLYKLEEDSYEWIGIRQGRHNNIIRHKYHVKFKVEGDRFIYDPENKTNDLPDIRDVWEAIQNLNISQSPKLSIQKKKSRTIYHNQLTLNL